MQPITTGMIETNKRIIRPMSLFTINSALLIGMDSMRSIVLFSYSLAMIFAARNEAKTPKSLMVKQKYTQNKHTEKVNK